MLATRFIGSKMNLNKLGVKIDGCGKNFDKLIVEFMVNDSLVRNKRGFNRLSRLE